jgi:threonine dehydratase
MLEDAGSEGFDYFFCPVSGGGLISGCAVTIAHLSPKTEIVGVEPREGNDTFLSLSKGERTKIPPPNTIADGLCVRVPGEKTWPVIQKHVRRIELVSDEELLDAMAFALLELRLVLEPSGAAALAVALREGRGRLAASGTMPSVAAPPPPCHGVRLGVMLSGGNVDPATLEEAARRASTRRLA